MPPKIKFEITKINLLRLELTISLDFQIETKNNKQPF